MRFNPPPNWPRLPDGWSPPPDWRPDPSWPQPPWGWPLWVEEDETFISPRKTFEARPTTLPWYRRTVTVVLALILFFPVGLVLLWMRPDWTVRRRGAITALIAVLVIIIAATNNHPPTTTTQLSPAAGRGSTSLDSSSSSASASATAAPSATTATPSGPGTAATSAPAKSSAPAVVAPPAQATTTQAAPPPPAPTTQAPPPPRPSTQAPPPKPSTCGAPSNPYGYNFCGVGGFVTSPASGVCDYFDCIDNFWNGRGYMVECNDGTYSMSGGIRGACSYHGGEDRPVYSG